MQQVTVSEERSVIQRSLDWITTRFGRKPTDLVFRGITLLLVFIVIATVIGVAAVLVVYSWPTFTDLLAAIPSVIIGLFGFLLLAPWLQQTGEPWLQKHLGFLPFFQGPIQGVGILAAGIVLTIMVLPLIIAVSREVMLTVPTAQR